MAKKAKVESKKDETVEKTTPAAEVKASDEKEHICEKNAKTISKGGLVAKICRVCGKLIK